MLNSHSLRLWSAYLLIGAMPFYAAAQGEDISSNKAALKTVQTKIASVDNNLDQLQEQQQKTRQQLADLDKKYAELTSIVKDYELQIAENTKLIRNTEKSIQVQSQHIKEQKNSLNRQLKSAYAVGQHDRLKFLLNQQDPALSSRMLGYYDFLNKLRLQKMAQLAENIKLQQQLEKEHADEIQRLQPLQQAKQVEQENLLKVKQQRAVLLAQLGKDIDSSKARLQDLHADEQNLKALISRLQREAGRNHEGEVEDSPKQAMTSKERIKTPALTDKVNSKQEDTSSTESSLSSNRQTTEVSSNFSGNGNARFASLKGRLPWPVSGNVLQPYGSSKLDGNLQGILIGAHAGSPVRAIAAGKVAYSGWLRGYGMLTIINHSNGYMSVYAFNQSLHKRVGEPVRAGETIAAVGQGSGQQQAGLYFEIRQQGSPLNPSAWCKK